MTGEASKRGCLKTGCLGCGAVLALVVIACAVIVGIALMLGAPERQLERSELSREVPRRPAAPASATAGPIDPPGRVVLDLSVGRFQVFAGEPGQPLRVDGDFDSGSYELIESWESVGETGWVYRVSFGRKVSWIRQLFQDDPGDNRIRITIPRDAPVALEGSIGIGESELELGGLALTRVELDVGMGDHYIGFDEPTPFPMEKFRVAASIGELQIDRLGEASPAEVWVSHRLGELDLDLRGEWRSDSEVSARCGIGACLVNVPRDVAVDVEKADVRIGERDLSELADVGPLEGAPRLSLSITAGMGELRVDR